MAISVVLPVADLIARRIYHAQGWVFPIKAETTGLGTYVLAITALVILSLLSRKKTKFWDLGEAVREMNAKKST